MKQRLIIIGILVSLALGILCILILSSDTPNKKRNGFLRKNHSAILKKISEISFSEGIKDLAGVTDDSLFIGTMQPGRLIVIDMNLQHSRVYDLSLDDSGDRIKSNFHTYVDADKVYTFGSNAQKVIRYDLATGEKKIFQIGCKFNRAVLLPHQAIVVRAFDSTRRSKALKKINLVNSSFIEDRNVISRTNDGGFSTDGLIHYDITNNQLVYVHFYSNKIYYLDTNLNLLFKGSSIDTFSEYQAIGRAKETSEGTSFTFAAPPNRVNGFSYVKNGKLYILSRLKADNESDDLFGHHSIIDVYDVKGRNYEGSIYVPKYSNESIFNFLISGNCLVTLYDRVVATYQIERL